MTEYEVLRRGDTVIAVLGEEIIPVTDMFDHEGDPCEELEDAAYVVAGPDRRGKWHTIDLTSPFESIH